MIFKFLLSLMVASLSLLCESQLTAEEATQTQSAQTQTDSNLAASKGVADQWLTGVDGGSYEQSWANASKLTQSAMPQNQWIVLMEKTRKPLGRVVQRTLALQSPSENPQGLPKGHYMVLLYKTKFDNKAEGRELVTMHLEDDGQWRVLTYQVA